MGLMLPHDPTQMEAAHYTFTVLATYMCYTLAGGDRLLTLLHCTLHELCVCVCMHVFHSHLQSVIFSQVTSLVSFVHSLEFKE